MRPARVVTGRESIGNGPNPKLAKGGLDGVGKHSSHNEDITGSRELTLETKLTL